MGSLPHVQNFVQKSFLLLAILAQAAIAARLSSYDLEEAVQLATEKYTNVLIQNPTSIGNYPHTGHPDSAEWDGVTDLWGWTAGFYPGVMWQLYRLTLDETWAKAALIATESLRPRQNDTGTHDLGFVIMSSFGLGLKSGFGGDNASKWEDVIIQAAKSLSTRFVENAGVIRSWNTGEPGEVTVIVDNMMNLDLLFTAASITGNHTFINVALSHTNRTTGNHFRPDYSTYHVVAYSDQDGSVLRRYTAQGYLDNSTWSRGQAWALYGYVETAEWTGDRGHLHVAEEAAKLFLTRLPPDSIPYWDFDAGRLSSTSYQPRDTSAAAVAAHGLLRLSLATGNQGYLYASETIMQSLLENYSARSFPVPALSINGTVFRNEGNFDTAIIYGDYYLLRYIEDYLKLMSSL